MYHAQANDVQGTQMSHPTIGGSTPATGAVTTSKALPAQAWHKVPILDNSGDDNPHRFDSMRKPQICTFNAVPTKDDRDLHLLLPQYQGSDDRHAVYLLQRPPFTPFLTPFFKSEHTHRTRKGLNTPAHRKLKEQEKAAACKATSGGPSKVVTLQDNTVHLFMAPPTTSDTTARILKPRAVIQQRNLKHGQLINSKAPCITLSHRSRHYPSSLANPTKITLGENSDIPATSMGVPMRMHTSGQQTCAVLQDILYVPDSRGSSLFIPYLFQQHSEALSLYTMHMEVNDSAPTKITTLSIQNAEATITALATHPLHAAKSGAPLGLQH
jgi:hypothetical protein